MAILSLPVPLLSETPGKHDDVSMMVFPSSTLTIYIFRAILHNPATFPNPSVFNPDRFLASDHRGSSSPDFSPLDPLSVTFGYGRRICPGRYMAEAQLWISIACILATFDIACGVDEMGRLLKPEPAFTSGLIR